MRIFFYYDKRLCRKSRMFSSRSRTDPEGIS